MKKIKKSSISAAFTLIELLVVIAIIGILSAVVITALSSSKDKANKAAAKQTIQNVSRQIEMAAIEGGTINPPTSATNGGGNICTGCSSTATWPSIAKTGYSYTGVTAGPASGSFNFTLTKVDKPTIKVDFTNGTGKITEVAYTPPAPTIHIGDTYQGGIIFYIDGTGEHGLIASTEDQSNNVEWDSVFSTTGATDARIGSGKSNTNTILSRQTGTHAAQLARSYNGGGYTDWYLPSKDELTELYIQKESVGKNFDSGTYWTSTETGFKNANTIYFSNGEPLSTDKTTKTSSVRAIRSF